MTVCILGLPRCGQHQLGVLRHSCERSDGIELISFFCSVGALSLDRTAPYLQYRRTVGNAAYSNILDSKFWIMDVDDILAIFCSTGYRSCIDSRLT